MANEGKRIATVGRQAAEPVVECVRRHLRGKEAQIIDGVVADRPRPVVMRTGIGGTRIADPVLGEQPPRIC